MAGTEAGTIFTVPVLVVRQKTKMFEVDNQYTVHDHNGDAIAEVRQVGQGLARKTLRFLGTPADRLLTFKLQVTDPGGNVLLMLSRPPKLARSKMTVEDGAGNEIGQIVQGNVVGKKTFTLQAGGQEVGKVVGKDWLSFDFVVQDHLGADVAHMSNTLEGMAMTDIFSSAFTDTFSSADSYVVEFPQTIDEQLRILVVAAALAIDVAIHQQ